MKKQSTRMKEDMWERIGHALLSKTEIIDYTGRSKDWVDDLLARVEAAHKEGQKKYWFYEDVAMAICECTPAGR